MVVLLLLGFLGYQLFISEPAVLQDADILSDTGIAGQDVLVLVDQLERISIDQNFFLSPLFGNLRDFSQTVLPEARGRINPFAAIGSDSSSSIDTSVP